MTHSFFDIKTIALTVVLTYAAVLLLAFVGQKRLTYFPGPRAFVPIEWDLEELQPVEITTEKGLVLTSWYRPAQDTAKLTIVFFQGNGGHFGYRHNKVRPWLNAGYGLLMASYPGYNGNPGSSGEEANYQAARAAVKTITQKGVKESLIVLYGESLGTGVAARMATEFDVAGLVLESPYTSLPDAGAYHYPLLPVKTLMRERYDTLSRMKDIKAPLLIIHGEKDFIVPIAFGRKVFEAAPEPKRAVFVPEAGHNDLYDWDVQKDFMAFLASLNHVGPE